MKTTNKNLLKIFLCHSSEDKKSVYGLYDKLMTDGFSVWFDEKSLLPGQNWEDEISNNITTSDIVLVCLSKSSVSKTGYVNKEIKFAFDKYDEKPDGAIFIIPARLEECEIPKRFRKFQWVNLFDVDGYKKLLKTLEKVISAKSDNELLSITLNAKLEAGFQPEFKGVNPSQIPTIYIPILIKEKNEPRIITITLQSTGDKEHDKKRIKTIYGTLISYHGHDQFSFRIFKAGEYHLVNFPNDTTRICSELVIRLHNILNPETKIFIDTLQEEETNENEIPF